MYGNDCLIFTPLLANFSLHYQHSSICDSSDSSFPFCILEKQISRLLRVDLTSDTPSKIQSSTNIRTRLASQDILFNIPHFIALYTKQVPKRNVQDQLGCNCTTYEKEKRLMMLKKKIASLLKISFLDEEPSDNFFPLKFNMYWTNVLHHRLAQLIRMR
ncbi:unnamed protein product [Vicia faba]|uniref:Uncharacterized protein n=1 Tax=Vicia faba TaxID=3906 RepID=A0AAV1ALM8_VICFA|nr:unnamed protein product [Vicia faba]